MNTSYITIVILHNFTIFYHKFGYKPSSYGCISSYIQKYLELHPWAQKNAWNRFCQTSNQRWHGWQIRFSWSKDGDLPCTAMIVSSHEHPQKSSSRDPWVAFPDFQHASAHQKPSSLTPMAAYGPYGCFSKLGLVPQPGNPTLTSVSHDFMAPGWWHRECFRCRFGLCLNGISHVFFGISNL